MNQVAVASTSQQASAIQRAFFARLPASTKSEFIFGKTVVVGNYAIQVWKSPNGESAGESLLIKRDPSKGWVLINVGGGWTVSALVSEGVPLWIAKKIMEQLP